MNGSSGRYAVLVLLSTAILFACSTTTTTVRKIYENPDFDGAPFSQFLIVGISENRDSRRHYETMMVSALADHGIKAVASTRVMKPGVPMDQHTVAAAAKESGSDAVLVARLKSAQTEAQIVKGPTSVKIQPNSGNPINFSDYDYEPMQFRYNYETMQNPDSLEIERTVVVATDVYEVASGEKVWGVESTTFDKKGMHQLIDSESSAVVRQLKRDGLAR